MVGRQGPDQGVRGSQRPDRSSNGQMGVLQARWWGWGTGMGYQTVDSIPDT